MFKLKKNNVVSWPVIISEPVDGGKTNDLKVTVRFDLLPQSEFKTEADKGDICLVKRVLKGWSDFGDEDGNDLPFTPENIDAVLQIGYVRTGILKAYMQASSGAAAKN